MNYLPGPLQTTLRATAVGMLLLLLTGCHGDTAQGGAPDRGHAGTSAPRQRSPQNRSVPTPPSADQIDPSSPQAVLDGTSTTSPGQQQRPNPTPPPKTRSPQ